MMKRKEVEDVMGGKDAWANVDKTDGMAFWFFCLCFMEMGGYRELLRGEESEGRRI